MKTLEMTQAKGDLASYAEQVRKEPMVVTDRGRPVMALLPIENADLETATLSNDPRFIAMIERSRVLYPPGSGIPLEEIRRKYGLQRKPRAKGKRRTARAARKGRSPRSR
jgi:prevent-host-death family protein